MGQETIEARVSESPDSREVFIGVFVDDDLNAFVTTNDVAAMTLSSGYWVVAAPLLSFERLVDVTVSSRVMPAFDYETAWLSLVEPGRVGNGRCVAVTMFGHRETRKSVMLRT
jgi:hypothetical protein